LKNPLHLTTTGLVFNQKTGDAWTKERLDFRVPQASGSAVGAKYVGNDGVLTLQSHVRIEVNRETPSTITAERAVLQKATREVVLWRANGESPTQRGQADQVTLFLRDDTTLERVLGEGNVQVDSKDSHGAPTHVRAEKLEVHVGTRDAVQNATLAGNVELRADAPQSMEAQAGRAELTFAGHSTLRKIHADQGVSLWQGRKAADKTAQDVRVTAPAMDFYVAEGKRLSRVETIGPPEILLAGNEKQDETHVTADKFTATFDSTGELARVQGAPNAKVVSKASAANKAKQPDRVSVSDSITAQFRPGQGVVSLVQSGHFTYTSGTQRAFADQGSYKPGDQVLELSGSPRIIDAGMETTAHSIRLNRV